jgi:hypothetical protein
MVNLRYLSKHILYIYIYLFIYIYYICEQYILWNWCKQKTSETMFYPVLVCLATREPSERPERGWNSMMLGQGLRSYLWQPPAFLNIMLPYHLYHPGNTFLSFVGILYFKKKTAASAALIGSVNPCKSCLTNLVHIPLIHNNIWLVVFRLPLWKMMEWKSVGVTIPKKNGKIKNVPNHQPDIG